MLRPVLPCNEALHQVHLVRLVDCADEIRRCIVTMGRVIMWRKIQRIERHRNGNRLPNALLQSTRSLKYVTWTRTHCPVRMRPTFSHSLGRKQPFRTTRNHQSSALPYPSREVCKTQTTQLVLASSVGWFVAAF
ncbi:hypothetical protein NSPZN2_40647 [Nitrospira defluvii]|uniref:Uncharacterized protein n=1 Tax=Nitrospira defluvii TaxID=330214 RepID=A0ABM8RYG1_9BACT|nr:hypothetical protein NSPZN2_40647 [Nitrospira defluvii]